MAERIGFNVVEYERLRIIQTKNELLAEKNLLRSKLQLVRTYDKHNFHLIKETVDRINELISMILDLDRQLSKIKNDKLYNHLFKKSVADSNRWANF